MKYRKPSLIPYCCIFLGILRNTTNITVSLRVVGLKPRSLKGNQGIVTTQWECVSMLAVMSTESSVYCSEKRAPLCDTVIKTNKYEMMSYCLKIVPIICTM
jgi:hypothetical protein